MNHRESLVKALTLRGDESAAVSILNLIKAEGAPLVIQEDQDNRTLLLMVEGDSNTKNAVYYSRTAESKISEYTMQRAGNSIIWYKILTIPRSTLATYSFGFNDSLEGWPGGPENPDGDFIARIANHVPDPLNRGIRYRTFSGALPNYYASVIGDLPALPPARRSVSVESMKIDGRNCWHVTDSHPNAQRCMLILFDGDYYLDDLEINRSYSKFTELNRGCGLELLLIDNPQETRRTDLFDGPEFYKFISDNLATRFCGSKFSKVFLGGLSAGGYAAVRLATNFSDRFAGALSQSGSFFWPKSNDTKLGRYPLVEQQKSSKTSLAHQRYSLQVGSFESLSEINMVDCSAKMAQALKQRGAKTNYYVSDTCHEGIGWQAEFLKCLEGLLV